MSTVLWPISSGPGSALQQGAATPASSAAVTESPPPQLTSIAASVTAHSAVFMASSVSLCFVIAGSVQQSLDGTNGKAGGAVRSERKSEASRSNGKLGGRPKSA
jgi:hypothetical protein